MTPDHLDLTTHGALAFSWRRPTVVLPSLHTHLGEAGADATIIMAKGHWRSIRTAARYTRPGLAAITTATELLDPHHRRA